MGYYTQQGYSLETAKQVGLQELVNWHAGKALDVFDCDALGQLHRYYCSESDQLRMINGKIANVSVELVCGLVPSIPDTDPIYDRVSHTSTQAGKVHTDYVQFSKDIDLAYAQYKEQISNATSVEAIETLLVSLRVLSEM